MNKLIFILFLSILTVTLIPNLVKADNGMLEVPENTEEAQSFITDIWNKMKETLPGEIEKIWKQEVVPLWSKMMDIWSEWWDTSIQPWSQTTWDKIMTILGQEVEKRKPYVEQELQKEKEELIEEADQKIPEQGRSIWERFKELIQ